MDGFLRAMSDLITSPGYLEKEEVSRFIDISLVKKETKLDWGAIKNLHIDSSTITFLQVDQKTKSTNRIEDFNAQDDQRVLMVDFANKNLGGGVLSDGLVQEELLMLVYPEAMLGMLAMERPMEWSECVLIRNVRRISDYEYDKKGVVQKSLADSRLQTANIMAIDAKRFYRQKMGEQFEIRNIDRDLHKAYVAFSLEGFTTIRTGNWGAGAFNAIKELKFILQAMACAVAKRHMVYSCFDSTDYADLRKILERIDGKTIADIYSILSQGSRAVNREFGVPMP